MLEEGYLCSHLITPVTLSTRYVNMEDDTGSLTK